MLRERGGDVVLGSVLTSRCFSSRTESMYNAEKRGKRQVLVRPVSKVVIKFLQVMQKHGTFKSRTVCACARG
jgi:ribosomal protein S8